MHTKTIAAVSRFWRALDVDALDVGCVTAPGPGPARGMAQWRPFSRLADLLAALGRLAARNARGEALYARAPTAGGPLGHPGLILIDDLDHRALLRLKAAGHRPAAVVETSPGNCQVWLRACPAGSHMARGEAVHLARRLAAAYGGDRRAVASNQPGRLPGFTNSKPQYATARGFPYVLLREAARGTCPAAAEMLAALRAGNLLDTAPPRGGVAGKVDSGATALAAGDYRRAWNVEWARVQDEVERGTRPSSCATTSEVDFAAAVALLASGQPAGQVAAWLSAIRPGHGQTYADRTVANASAYLAHPERFWLHPERRGRGHAAPGVAGASGGWAN